MRKGTVSRMRERYAQTVLTFRITYAWIKKCTLTTFVALGMRSVGNVSKNGELIFGFCFTTMLQHTGHFGQGFLSKEQRDNSGETSIHTWPDSSWFLPVPLSKISTEGKTFCFVFEVIKIAMRELKRPLQMASRNVPSPLQSLEEAYICKWGEFSTHIYLPMKMEQTECSET